MGVNEHRQIARDSLFVMAVLRVDGAEDDHAVRVRNLSVGGLMVEGGPRLSRDQQVRIDIRNVGWIDGTVAWVQGNRCGIALHREIDPKAARAPVGSSRNDDAMIHHPAGLAKSPARTANLRKI